MLEHMDFNIDSNNKIEELIVGSWIGKQTRNKSSNKKYLYLFYQDKKFSHSIVSKDFVPSKKNIDSLLSGLSVKNGTYKITQNMIILEYDKKSSKSSVGHVQAYPVKPDGDNLYIDSILLQKLEL